MGMSGHPLVSACELLDGF